LDAARQTNQLSSKILIGQAIPKTLIYWAPELFSADRYDTGIDMWALGITFYQVIIGFFGRNFKEYFLDIDWRTAI